MARAFATQRVYAHAGRSLPGSSRERGAAGRLFFSRFFALIYITCIIERCHCAGPGTVAVRRLIHVRQESHSASVGSCGTGLMYLTVAATSLTRQPPSVGKNTTTAAAWSSSRSQIQSRVARPIQCVSREPLARGGPALVTDRPPVLIDRDAWRGRSAAGCRCRRELREAAVQQRLGLAKQFEIERLRPLLVGIPQLQVRR
jgi:hypothetical protein